MADYCLITDLIPASGPGYAYQAQAEDSTVLAAIITRVSRMFDSYVGVPANYFATGDPAPAASARKFWGDGTDYLKIDPHLSSPAPTIAMPDGFAAPPFLLTNPYQSGRMGQAAGEFFLARVYGENESRLSALEDRRDYFQAEFSNELDYIGWPNGIRVTVTAKWGWDAVPADIAEAVLETVVQIWRGKDQAFARVVNLESNTVYNDAWTPKAKMVADHYRQGRAMFA